MGNVKKKNYSFHIRQPWHTRKKPSLIVGFFEISNSCQKIWIQKPKNGEAKHFTHETTTISNLWIKLTLGPQYAQFLSRNILNLIEGSFQEKTLHT